jgi:hypothetical protein
MRPANTSAIPQTVTGPSLERRRPDPAGLDFAGLRQTGIELLQELCGDAWSDYNLHDPGVTLLEQLCYGLTDLAYRSRFAPEDYLFGEDGHIDGALHALLPPEEVLPGAPLTPHDYRKLFADALPGIRNVWVVPAANDALPGLVDIHLQLADDIEEGSDQAQALLAEAADLYHRHRNLCEDLGEITLIGHVDYHLSGEVEVANGRSAAEILADIYFTCASAISPPIPQQPYHDLADTELDRLFDGPFTPHGHIDDDHLQHWNGPTLSELIRAISGVDGVTRVADLALLDDAGRTCLAANGDAAAKRMPRLVIPRQAARQRIQLRKAGQRLSVTATTFLDRFKRLVFAAESRRHSRAEHEPVSPLPTGAPADFGHYDSIQHHLPPVYGVGRYGLPASAPAERKAQAKQLQAYLLLFEQLMINFQQGLAALPRLFSSDETLDRSYFHRLMDEHDLPGVERLYAHGRTDADAALSRLLAQLDDFGDRRLRALDFLLALHGEEFDQRIVRNFITDKGRPTDTRLIGAKIAFLRQAPRINGRRMGAFDHRRAPGPDNIPALAEKIALLLDLPTAHGTAATEAVRAQGYRHLRDDEFLRQAGLDCVRIPESAENVVPLAAVPPQEGESVLAKGLLCPALLNRGNNLNHYRIVADGRSNNACSLYFAIGDDTGYCLLSHHPTKRAAVIEANRLSRFIDTLAAETAGFHLVEHLLLRPARQPADAAFHAMRISAIFPAWSPRFSNPEFRLLVEGTLARCCPAHIAVDVLWLNFETMAVFDHLHGEWLRLKRHPAAKPSALDRAAQVLALFLERQAPKPGERVRWL